MPKPFYFLYDPYPCIKEYLHLCAKEMHTDKICFYHIFIFSYMFRSLLWPLSGRFTWIL